MNLFRTRKAEALLYYLAVTRQAWPRQALTALLWGEMSDQQARTNLSKTLSELRLLLEPFVWTSRQQVELNPYADIWLDVANLDAAPSAPTTAAAYDELAQAVNLVRGDFLQGFSVRNAPDFEQWLLGEQERLHQRMVQVLDMLTDRALRQARWSDGIAYAQRLLSLEPLHEPAHRHLMALLAASDQRAAALQQYDRLAQLFAADLGAAPSPETVRLRDEIQAGETIVLPRSPDAGAAADIATVRRAPALPEPATSFFGRTQELAEIRQRLADPACRLLTLVGPGGIGKTRLALQAAWAAQEDFADGAILVELAPLDVAELIVPTLASALKFMLGDDGTSTTQVLGYLRQNEMLLILDNLEHLLAPVHQLARRDESNTASALLSEILRQAPRVTILVTSRERLNIQGEWVYDVGGLEIPDTATEQSPAAEGSDAETRFDAHSAVALFLQTARRSQRDFTPTAADRAAILRICQLVQGMPLALELAAAWTRVLSCTEIADEIEKSLGFLTAPLRNLPPRHRSLQAVFDHSWQLLSDAEQGIFACCSVFRGGFTREAAVQVAGASLLMLASLMDKSLLRRAPNGRYEIHELARQYAASRLDDTQQVWQTRNRHLVYFMHFAETAEPKMRGGPDVAHWLQRVEMEHDNVRAALDWSLHGGDVALGLRMVGALWEFWMNRGHANEGQRQAERFLSRPEVAAPTVERAKALHTAGVLAFYQGRHQRARELLAEGIAISRRLGDCAQYPLAQALIAAGYTHASLGDFDAVRRFSAETLDLGDTLQDRWVLGHALNQIGLWDWHNHDVANAMQHFLESYECFKADGQSVMRGSALQKLGDVLLHEGDYELAQHYLTQSLAIAEELGDPIRCSGALRLLGMVAMAQGNPDAADQYLTQALTYTRRTAALHLQVRVLDIMIRLAQAQGDHTRAHTLHQERLNSSQWLAQGS